ncbi:MAG: hypothetical protein KBA71_05035 [Opitutaceae bacterium]|nr:hypothetical protein [Opitutaceae bacterium]
MSRKPTLRVFATAWSLREYPTKETEWSWERKFDAITTTGFDGIMSPPRPELAARGSLEYWAMGSLGAGDDPVAYFDRVAGLGAGHATIQVCDVETPLEDTIGVVESVMSAARKAGIPVTIETHRDTFTETPEKTWALCDAFFGRTGEPLPVCFDHSHFAVVRHLAAPYWPKLNERPEVMARCGWMHLRPFNGHHCQIPATRDGREPAPEYLLWGDYVDAMFGWVQTHSTQLEVNLCPELGNAAPAYGLSCFPDIWIDAQYVAADLRHRWRKAGG